MTRDILLAVFALYAVIVVGCGVMAVVECVRGWWVSR